MSEGAKKNVIEVDFKPLAFKELAALYVELKDVVYKYQGEVPFAGVIGVLEMLKHTLTHTELED